MDRIAASGSTNNVYDFENHLVQHGLVTIVYDGDGNRVSKTAGGVTTKYLVDTNSTTGYAQVVEESQAGSVVRKYTYGLELINENQASGTSFYLFDGHGSVRQLTDTTGTVTDTYFYDAFGNLLSPTGSTPNLYRYSSEQFDSDLSLYYNRARYLDVRNGRFWGMDTAFGRVRVPESLHRYSFASQNPANATDPSGLEDADIGTNIAVADASAGLTVSQLQIVSDLVESVANPEVIAEAPQAFGFFAKAIAFLSIGTIALGSYSAATGGGGQVPVDQAVAEANTNNYDIYRFGNAQRTALLRAGDDYDLSVNGMIAPQNPGTPTFKGASAFRDPKLSGLSGVVWRIKLQNVFLADGLSVIADGKDTRRIAYCPSGTIRSFLLYRCPLRTSINAWLTWDGLGFLGESDEQ